MEEMLYFFRGVLGILFTFFVVKTIFWIIIKIFDSDEISDKKINKT